MEAASEAPLGQRPPAPLARVLAKGAAAVAEFMLGQRWYYVLAGTIPELPLDEIQSQLKS